MFRKLKNVNELLDFIGSMHLLINLDAKHGLNDAELPAMILRRFGKVINEPLTTALKELDVWAKELPNGDHTLEIESKVREALELPNGVDLPIYVHLAVHSCENKCGSGRCENIVCFDVYEESELED